MGNTSFGVGLPSDADWAAAKDRQVGRRLMEEYEVGEMLGEGAFGVVYAARHRESGTTVAVKMVDKVETPIAQIKKETELLQAVQHECIVKFHGVFFEKCFVCIVMDKYSGGDLIDGLHLHLKEKGKIDCYSVAHISFQMAISLSFIHGRNIAHRDVKGDNYLMDRKDIADPECRIALTDFGASTYVPQGERLSAEVGTRIFWAPEIFRRDYGPKVDIWAMGVTMYGLLDGFFPFKDEKEICKPTKELKFPKVDSACKDYLRAMLTRDEGARASSEDIMVHKWVERGRSKAPAGLSASSPHPSHEKPRRTSDVTVGQVAPMNDGKNTQDEKMGEGMRDDVNVGVMERRRELLERLNKEHAKAEKHRRGRPTPKEESQHFWAKWFTIADKRMGETLKFEWWGEEQVKKSGILAMAGMSQQPEDAHGDMDKSPLVVGQMLRDCDIDTKAFGTGRAKTLEQLAAEVQSGAARLMLDATDYKKLVRVVDVVLLRLVSAPAQEEGTEKRILVETGEQYPDGRRRDTHRMPGAKKLPHETSKEVAQRVLKDFLNMDSVAIHFDFDCKEVYEEEEISPSFPGVTTVYRKEIVQCYVHETSRSALAMIGLPRGDNWTAEEANHQIRYLAWMSEEQAVAAGVKLRAEGSEEVSGLVMAPIGLAEDDLAEVLQHNGADPSLFGKGAAKSLKDFSTELVKGEASLMAGVDGGLVRVVDIVLLKLVNPQASEMLVLSERTHSGGEVDSTPGLPSAKRRPDENQFLTVKRILRRQLKIDENRVKINAKSVRYYQEEKTLPEFPGITTVFRRRVIAARLRRNRGD
jgi:serine/threonine protein kinase